MLSSNMRGSLFMVTAMAVFTFNDATVKYLSDSLPIPQIVLLRGIITTAMVAAIVLAGKRATLRQDLSEPVIWWRALMEIGATYTYLVGLKHIPIANAASIFAAVPLAVTVGSAVFFHEPVGWRRWLAIIVGFLGVLIIVRPGFENFSVYSFYIVLCVGFATVRDLITRNAPPHIPSLTFSLATSIAITLTGVVFTAGAGRFVPVEPGQYGLILMASCFLLVGYFCAVSAVRNGEIAVISPFRYTSLIWATSIGYIVFNEKLDFYSAIGSLIVVSSGIYTLYRERRLAINRDRERRIPQSR